MRVENYVGDCGERGLVKLWADNVPIEHDAMRQLQDVAILPFIYKWIAAMPDVHVGMGATIGSVIPTKGAVVPAAVGVDIGCGMRAVQVTRPELSPKDMLEAIPRCVPVGRSNNGGVGDVGAWDVIPSHIDDIWLNEFAEGYHTLINHYSKILTKYGPNTVNHLGTLGTGNHFIEVCREILNDEKWWVVLHSGSRGVGNRLGSFFIKKAKEECEKWHISLPNKDLAYFPEGTQLFDDYMFAMEWAQKFAYTNRAIMMDHVLTELKVEPIGDTIDCHHNFVARENHFGENILVTRKGAVRARKGDYGIIPGSMGAKTYIVRGKGNPDSFMSCAHGAGRVMSRGKARASITVDQHVEATSGVACKKTLDVIDESPAAYKDIDAVMEAQKDLVEVITTIKQVVCVKG